MLLKMLKGIFMLQTEIQDGMFQEEPAGQDNLALAYNFKEHEIHSESFLAGGVGKVISSTLLDVVCTFCALSW